MGNEQIQRTVKDYVLREFLPGEGDGALQHDTPLISGGILDSVSTIKLVSFLEDQFKIEFGAHEVSADVLDTLDSISTAVESKMGQN